MRIGPPPPAMTAQMSAAHFAQCAQRVASHRSSPTDRPVTAPDAVTDDTVIRRPSRHTFDIRV
ncbi:hypothetical protein [Brevundimonas sp. Root1423]|uniref:hypothetical protein n=1 Tax=Brevundimonas sp. Root1423 TaxID=1736462 RepID=UPI0006FB7212|nr:hypothetical protein [Brevundimonas sp. Root1423]KQY89769.1 hypothetical protein ASD25_04360 [Brevundimonas sp. Root1423]